MEHRARAAALIAGQGDADAADVGTASPSGDAPAGPQAGGETFKEGGERRPKVEQQQQHKTEGQAAAAAAAAKFEEIVTPLEKASGKPLGGPGLELCRTAFHENPHGFRVCAADALRRATIHPLGLLIRMVRDEDHRDVAPPSAPSSTAFQRAERWVHNAGCQLEPADFLDELAQRFADLDDLANQRLSRLYEQRRAGAGEGAQ